MFDRASKNPLFSGHINKKDRLDFVSPLKFVSDQFSESLQDFEKSGSQNSRFDELLHVLVLGDDGGRNGDVQQQAGDQVFQEIVVLVLFAGREPEAEAQVAERHRHDQQRREA